MKYFFVILLLSFLAIVGAACGGAGDGSDDKDSGDGRSESVTGTLSSIQTNIFTPTCATSGCHSSSAQSGGVSLASGESFGELVGVASDQASTLSRVKAGSAVESYLINKLEGTQGGAGGSGAQMPKGASALSAEKIQAIKEWITNGASNN